MQKRTSKRAACPSLRLPFTPAISLVLALLLLAFVLGYSESLSAQTAGAVGSASALMALPDGPRKAAIQEGRLLMTDTAHQMPQYVGNVLTCSNCHLGAGTVSEASPFTGLWGVFPEYRSRSGKIISLEERINDCMQRSMNGRALAYNSSEMDAMLAYIQWLSEGVPTGTSPRGRGFGTIDTALSADGDHGKAVYAARCASCHGPNGAGIRDAKGASLVPPLWGPESFNVGAGMARTYTAAAFIRHNMPLGQADHLSDQDAVDVAQFVTHQPRPDFAGRSADWPKGDAPPDARK